MIRKILLVLIILLPYCANSYAQDDSRFIYLKDSIITVGNNKLTLASAIDSIFTTDPVTKNKQLTLDYMGYRSATHKGKIILSHVPVQLNGEKVFSLFSEYDVQHAAKLANGKRYLAGHLQHKMKWQYKKLNKTGYNADIRNVVVNKDGHIVYYEYSGVYKTDTFNPKKLKASYIARIDKKVEKILDNLQMIPATVNSNRVNYRLKHYELL